MPNLYSQQQKEKIENLFRINDWYGKREKYTFALTQLTDQLLSAEEETTLEELLDKLTPSSVLDYGSGYGLAIDHLKKKYPNIKFVKYDPFVPEYSIRPQEKFDLVVSHRVLRIVEPEFKEQVVQDMYNLTKGHLVLSILLYEVDGISYSWWTELLSKYNILQQGLGLPQYRQGYDNKYYNISNAGFLIKK